MIISPWFFYAIQVCDNVGCALCVLGFLGMFIGCALFLGVVMDAFWCEEDTKRAIRFAKKSLIVGVISCAIAVFVPTKETLIEMQIAKVATKENIENAVTYVIDTVKEFTEEDK